MTKIIQKELNNKEGRVKFSCPKCLNTDITRTLNARKIGTKYTCTCGFEGPN
ncbi:RNA-binding protein [Candidatus Woesearchaeota archaeon CG10_big_fil_rev_8_21_14_0_10_37_12]|nr:MAG: RNA-binding protein [Candidatus Woesearchaeota archaeon CG10_big_fil_rev_8_21_14_0_10_37_12]